MRIKKPDDLKASEITAKEMYLNRRQFIASTLGAGAALAGIDLTAAPPAQALEKLPNVKKGPAAYNTSEKLNSLKDITSYNNFYELGVEKGDPELNAKYLISKPWSIEIEGEVKKPKTFAVEDIMKLAPLEERVYRLRCVEAWSMVIPWIGFPLSALINQVEPTNNAKFIQFVTLVDPKRMPGQKPSIFGNSLDWPYVEGLRMDEAMHPLTILSVGLYGEILPAQNGAPLRLVVPWKYGFKSIKSIVKVRFVEKQPATTWNKMQPQEYGFYSNVNPEVDHPRWTQASERRIGEFLRRKTLPFNGYGDHVASLYKGMDLKKFF
ncbi:MAG TPA: protein-methionine-sulfoxide reductase catalytic subunit MsrP [Candidatus Limnocylindrales bacterium]|nr:protein-methionine-sulfoxide reductase catalytic subunit MsrP [Candidatus Limnocylindrales bacterium]